jgi:hypothetical protein
MFRRFEFLRETDATGISGIGRVAEGVQFGDGRCAVRWLSKLRSTAVYDNFGDVEGIHGHDGLTTFRWLDD